MRESEGSGGRSLEEARGGQPVTRTNSKPPLVGPRATRPGALLAADERRHDIPGAALEKIPTVFGAAMIAACLEVIGAIVSDMQKAIDFYQRPDRVHRDLIDGLPTGLR
jgi:hypothetical protein